MAEELSPENIVLDLEEQLQEDSTGEKRDQLRLRFTEEIETLDGKLRQGVSQETFSHLQTLKKGYEAACHVIDDMWRVSHPSS